MVVLATPSRLARCAWAIAEAIPSGSGWPRSGIRRCFPFAALKVSAKARGRSSGGGTGSRLTGSDMGDELWTRSLSGVEHVTMAALIEVTQALDKTTLIPLP